jgi:hypothetical protein
MREAVEHAALATARAVRPSIGLGSQQSGSSIGKRAPAGVFARLSEVLRFHQLVELCLLTNRGGGGISNFCFLGGDMREHAY